MSQVNTFARNKAGKLIINPRKLDVQYYQLVPDDPNNPISVAPAASSGPIQFTVGQDGPFEAFYLTQYRRDHATNLETQAHAAVDVYDEGAKRSLMNREIHVDTIFGRSIGGVTVGALGALVYENAGLAPHILAESLFVHATRTMVVRLRNLEPAMGVTQDFFPVIHGTRWYGYANPSKSLAIAVEKRSARSRISTPYFMTTDTDIAALAATAAANYFLTVTSEGHFEWWKTAYVSNVDFSLQIFDVRNGRSFSNGPVYCKAGIGSAALPFILPEHTVLQANSKLRLAVVNLSTTTALTGWITLCGRRIYVG